MKYKLILQLFTFTPNVDPGSYEVNPVNVTTQASMAANMKTFYDTSLLQNSHEREIFDQFALKQPISRSNKVEWRKWNTFKKALTPLVEGVIPTGQSFGMTKIEATITQHGDYTSVSDRLSYEGYNDTIYGATEEMGATAGETKDTLTRNVLIAGNSVAYCPTVSGGSESPVTARKDLDKTAVLTPKMVNKAFTFLKKNHAPRFAGNTYVAIIHPSVAFDLRESNEWKEIHKYADVDPIFKGEIGTLHGVRFIESTEAKIWCGADLTAGARNLTVKTAITTGTTTVAVKEVITSDDAAALAGRKILLGTVLATVASANAAAAGSATLTLTANVEDIAANTVVYPGEAGAGGTAAYATLFLGKDAYGVVEPSGETMQMIIHDASEIGGPLNQFSTIGYKFCHATKILYQERMLRVESGSSYGDDDEEN